MKFNILLSAVLAAMLVGCGSGSSSSDDTKESPETQTETPANEQPQAPAAEAITNIAYIEGVYDISKDDGDTIYLSIDSSGLIATYDYMGDAVDKGANCYSKNSVTGYNTTINGLTVRNDEANKAFTVDGGYQWYYGDNQNISKVSLGFISAGGILSINNLRIATSQYLTTAVTVSEMEQSLCE